jgi:hypothetical protein
VSMRHAGARVARCQSAVGDGERGEAYERKGEA